MELLPCWKTLSFPKGDRSITSAALKLPLEQWKLRFYKPATAENLLSHAEAEATCKPPKLEQND
ncbi:hypothetical protein IFO70_19740 [Phormidium tenue FACHB-886]|nr:hypothetical protein [Phormidium tenue FACHB-886]